MNVEKYVLWAVIMIVKVTVDVQQRLEEWLGKASLEHVGRASCDRMVYRL